MQNMMRHSSQPVQRLPVIQITQYRANPQSAGRIGTGWIANQRQCPHPSRQHVGHARAHITQADDQDALPSKTRWQCTERGLF